MRKQFLKEVIAKKKGKIYNGNEKKLRFPLSSSSSIIPMSLEILSLLLLGKAIGQFFPFGVSRIVMMDVQVLHRLWSLSF